MLLALLLAAAPEIEAMSLDELLVEDTRLELTPGPRGPAVMAGIGLGVAALGTLHGDGPSALHAGSAELVSGAALLAVGI